MCNQLASAFRVLKSYHYIRKTNGRTVEGEVADLIAQHIGGKVVQKGGKETAEKFMGRLSRLAKPYIILQPNGSQNPPDLRVVLEDKTVDIECKRSETGKVMWNSGYPKSATVYIYNGLDNSSTEQHTTFVLGGDLISLEEETALESMLDTFRGMKATYNTGLLRNGNFQLEHIRPMYKETGQNRWLIHPEKRAREDRVLQYLAAQGGSREPRHETPDIFTISHKAA